MIQLFRESLCDIIFCQLLVIPKSKLSTLLSAFGWPPCPQRYLIWSVNIWNDWPQFFLGFSCHCTAKRIKVDHWATSRSSSQSVAFFFAGHFLIILFVLLILFLHPLVTVFHFFRLWLQKCTRKLRSLMFGGSSYLAFASSMELYRFWFCSCFKWMFSLCRNVRSLDLWAGINLTSSTIQILKLLLL